jgi:hypothetical protein
MTLHEDRRDAKELSSLLQCLVDGMTDHVTPLACDRFFFAETNVGETPGVSLSNPLQLILASRYG